MRAIDNNDDIIDSRDIIARIVELEEEDRDESEDAELDALRKLAADGENAASDWPHGATLIRDSYFRTYAEELADDIGAIGRELNWPLTCIDWEQAADELRADYTSIDFDGVTYWVRS